jgi:hypothetical protein
MGGSLNSWRPLSLQALAVILCRLVIEWQFILLAKARIMRIQLVDEVVIVTTDFQKAPQAAAAE